MLNNSKIKLDAATTSDSSLSQKLKVAKGREDALSILMNLADAGAIEANKNAVVEWPSTYHEKANALSMSALEQVAGTGRSGGIPIIEWLSTYREKPKATARDDTYLGQKGPQVF